MLGGLPLARRARGQVLIFGRLGEAERHGRSLAGQVLAVAAFHMKKKICDKFEFD